MSRMLGRHRATGNGSCGKGACRHCQDGSETRRFKRQEQRAVQRVIRDGRAERREADHGERLTPGR